MFISDALAQETATAAEYVSANSVSGTLVQLGLIFLIFYFLLIRPQQKKMREHENMLAAIKKGDKVITGGGVYGTVTAADEEKLTVRIADNTEVVVARASIRESLSEDDSKSVRQSAAKKQKKTSKK